MRVNATVVVKAPACSDETLNQNVYCVRAKTAGWCFKDTHRMRPQHTPCSHRLLCLLQTPAPGWMPTAVSNVKER